MTSFVAGLLVGLVLTFGFIPGFGVDIETEASDPILVDSINEDIDPVGIIEGPDPIPQNRNDREK